MAKDWLEQPLPLKGKRIWIDGHRGMVGSALMRRLQEEGCDLLTVDRMQLDLRHQSDIQSWMGKNKPDMVIVAAAKVGGIAANSNYPAAFFYDNTMIATNIIQCAYEVGVEKLLFLGSSCIYPRDCPQPIKESYLLSGPLEPTNEAYALAKIGALKMAQFYRKQYGCDFISAMPCNLYGVGDKYDEQGSHVIPALIMKAHSAKMRGDKHITVWGTGKPLREFLYVDDLADALVFLLKNYSGSDHINIGSGQEISIKSLAETICEEIDFKGKILFDPKKPDGTPRKVLDNSRMLDVGWETKMWLKNGINKSYTDYLGRYGDETGT